MLILAKDAYFSNVGSYKEAKWVMPLGIPYNGQYGEVPPERGTMFRLQVYDRVPGISLVEVYMKG